MLVTGSTGGVGSIALQILSKIGYKNITALVRKDYQVEVAKSLGATEVVFASQELWETIDAVKNGRHLDRTIIKY